MLIDANIELLYILNHLMKTQTSAIKSIINIIIMIIIMIRKNNHIRSRIPAGIND